MSVVTQPFHAAVNHLLEREPWARDQLVPYVGKRARLNIPPFSVVMRIAPSGLLEPVPTSLTDSLDACDTDDVTITVLPDALSAVFDGGMSAAMKHVRIGGDAEFAATLGKLAEHLRWDPEEDLARFIGDAPAYRIARTVRGVAERARRATRGMFESMAEYLLDESPQCVRHQAVESFGEEVGVLRDDVERLDKRIDRLERRSSNLGGRA